MSTTEVVVVGGGLAGMVAALRLLERGCRVAIYEASDRLGGKAGAGLAAQAHDDHGYHIFPAWYLNTWKLVDELGIRRHFVDCEEFWQMRLGEFPRAHSFRNLSSIRFAWHNLRSGVLPVPQAFLFFYAALDLMSQPYSYRAQLDRVTVSGFLRARAYRTEPISAQFEELMLKGISVPTYQVSAMTMRNAMRYWFRYPLPMHRILDGGLHDKWILPLQRRIEELGGTIHTGHHLERLELAGGMLARLWFRSRPAAVPVSAARTILAIPCEKLWPLLDDDLIAQVPELARTRYLRSTPMAALNLYFERPIPGMPKGHVNLLDSLYGLSFIDVTPYWPAHDGGAGSALQIIASDFTPLVEASPAYAERAIIDELKRCIPALCDETIVRSNFLPHHDEPLFMNDVGAWSFRPDAATSVPNLYLAGDYCRSAIDLVSMEGAISTGLLAAEAVRADAGLAPAVEILVPKIPPPWLLAVGRYALLPFAMLAKLWTVLTGKNAGQHDAQARLDEQRARAHQERQRPGAGDGAPAQLVQAALDQHPHGLRGEERPHQRSHPAARSR
jgi:uncharacterized protein with NAD-binding domain and iron-sulfur cluster